MTKKTLILLPALMCDENLYKNQITILEETFNVIIPVIKNINNIKDAASYVLEMAKKTPFSLAGTSMGGYIAMELMRTHSHLIERLCLINTRWDEDSPQQKQNRLSIIDQAKNTKNEHFIGVNDDAINKYVYNNTPENNSLIKNMVKSLGKDTLISQQELILSRKSSVDNFKNYKCPTLVIGGQEDEITPANVQKDMYLALPKGNIVIFNNCKHLSPIDQGKRLSSLLALWFGA